MKWKKIFCMALVSAVVVAGCGKKEETPKEPAKEQAEIDQDKIVIERADDGEEASPTPEAGQVKSYLTGLDVPESVGRRRPVAIMLNNIQAAVPQTGISRAGVVYEAPVEGDITRLMGIFENYDDLEKIGSVRSCRDYYIFYAQEFDAVYAHYGQAIYAKPYLEQDFIHNLSGLSSYGDDIYYRTSDRKAPHNVYIGAEGLQKGMEINNYPKEYSPEYDGHYLFAGEGESVDLPEGAAANKVELPCFTVNSPWFEYDGQTKKYKRFQYGGPQIDDMTGEQLAYDNIILQYSEYKPYDANGYLNIDPISGGAGKFITHGKAVDITWEKESPYGVTHYFDGSGQEIKLNPGTTWVSIVLNDSVGEVVIS